MGGGGALPDFFFYDFFPCKQTTSEICYRVKQFFELATNTMNNVRNNYTYKLRILLLYGSMALIFSCCAMFGGSAWRLI